MVPYSLPDDITTRVRLLSASQQEQALAYVSQLASAAGSGSCGEKLARFAGSIDPGDLAVIAAAIDDGCERPDDGNW